VRDRKVRYHISSFREREEKEAPLSFSERRELKGERRIR